MGNISKEQYEYALAKVEELLPLVNDDTPANDKAALELALMSEIVIAYEEKHFPIGKPTVAELIALSLQCCKYQFFCKQQQYRKQSSG